MSSASKFIMCLVACVLNLSTALACETSYIRQHVTQNDKLNSRGAPLSDPAAFLQQDRYWFHAKGQSDQLDIADFITTTKEARAWYGKVVREHISPDAAYVAMAGDFIAVVSYDVCSFTNESAERDAKLFINYVDIAPYENGFYQLAFRYIDAKLVAQITGLDEYQADSKSQEIYNIYLNNSGTDVSPEDATISYIPNADVFVLQVGACGQAVCPFGIVDANGNTRGRFEAEYGFVYSEQGSEKMLLTRLGALLYQF